MGQREPWDCFAWGSFQLRADQPLVALRTTARRQALFTSLIVGAAIVGLGYLALLGLMHSVQEIVLGSCIVTAGMGFAYAAMPALIMAAVPVAETAAANALNTLMRSIGVSIASAMIAVVMSHSEKRFDGAALPTTSRPRAGFLIALADCIAAAAPRLPSPASARPAPHPNSPQTPHSPRAESNPWTPLSGACGSHIASDGSDRRTRHRPPRESLH